MLIPTPIVAIDDTSEHTDILAGGLASTGAGLIPLLWNGKLCFRSGKVELDFTTKLSGVRLVFCDFHLQKAKALSDKKTHHDTITGVIDDIISPDNGPFVLVIWTKHPGDIGGLEEYIAANTEKHCHPAAVISLSKEPYLNTKMSVKQAAELGLEITKLLKDCRGGVGLWFWERSVMRAAAQTVTSMANLASGTSDQESAGSIEDLLWRLAVAAVGEGHVSDRPAYALNEALAPILYDRLTALSSENDNNEIEFWQKALGFPRTAEGDIELSSSVVATINTALHIAKDGEAGNGTDRGAVIELKEPTELKEWSGITSGDIKDFIISRMKIAIPDGAEASIRLVVVQIQAACDFAQGNDSLVPYVLGVEAPIDVKYIYSNGKSEKKSPGYYFVTAPFIAESAAERILCLNPRFLLAVPQELAVGKASLYRLREALINQVAEAVYGYGARPGIVSVRKKI